MLAPAAIRAITKVSTGLTSPQNNINGCPGMQQAELVMQACGSTVCCQTSSAPRPMQLPETSCSSRWANHNVMLSSNSYQTLLPAPKVAA
jgi:hypothetical protein